MRLALIGAVRAETFGLLSLVGGLLLFLMGYVAGAQTRPIFVAPPQISEAAPPPPAVANTAAECPPVAVTPSAAPQAEQHAGPTIQTVPRSPDVVSPRRVRTTVIKDSPR